MTLVYLFLCFLAAVFIIGLLLLGYAWRRKF